MKILLDIPNYEFDNDVKDKFQDFFHRVYVDIANHENIMCGNYERETAEMFLASFNHATYLPKDMTNGDVIKLMFPSVVNSNMDLVETFKRAKEWWNTPYKAERSDTE